MSKRVRLIIDGSNLAYRTYAVFKNIRTKEEGRIGMVYGFLKNLVSYLNRFDPNELYITFDTVEGKKSNFRNIIHPGYKEGRKKNNLAFDYDDFNRQLEILKDSLKMLGLNIVCDNKGRGYESDDYIAYLSINAPNKALIISSDKDFVQLLDDKHIRLFHPMKDILLSYRNCEKEWGCTPKQALEMMKLIGDVSDSIPGYKGIGPVKAKAFVEEFGTLKKFIKNPKASFKGVTKEGVEFIEKRNTQLMCLRHFLKVHPIEKLPLLKTKQDFKSFDALMSKHGLTPYMTPAFKKIIKNIK